MAVTPLIAPYSANNQQHPNAAQHMQHEKQDLQSAAWKKIVSVPNEDVCRQDLRQILPDLQDQASSRSQQICSQAWSDPDRSLFHALDLVLHIHVQLSQALQLLGLGVPVAAAVSLQEGGHQLAEAVRVGAHQAVSHLGVLNEGGVGLIVHPVVNHTGGRGPAHGVGQTLLNLTHTLVAARKHALVPLGVEQLGAGVQAHGLAEGADLGVGGGGVGDVGAGGLAVSAQGGDQLGGVRVKVVADVSEGDLAAVQVLEGHVHSLHRALKHLTLRLTASTWAVAVEGKALALHVHLLQLALVAPAAVLHRQVDVGGVGARRVGEHAGGSLAQGGHAQLRSLLLGVLAHKVHLIRLVLLRSQLDGAVQQQHLVDEQVAEHTGAVHHHVHTGPAQLLQGDDLQLVHAAQSIRHRLDAHHHHDLGQGLAVGLDVVSAPQHQGNGLGVLAAVVVLLAVQQAVNHQLGVLQGSLGGDGLGVQGVDVLAGGQHHGVTDGVTTWARLHVLAVQGLSQGAQLVVLDHLLQAELQVAKGVNEVLAVGAGKLSALQGAHPGVHVEARELHELGHEVGADAAVEAGAVTHELAHAVPACLSDALQGVHLSQHALVVAGVDLLDVAANGAGQDAGQALDGGGLLVRAVNLTNVDQSSHSLLSSGGHTDHVQAAGQQAGLNLHQLAVHIADHHVALVQGQGLGSLVISGQLDVLVQVALAGSLNDGGTDLLTAAALPHALVAADQLLELLQALVQASVLSRGGQVGDGVGVGAALGNGGLAGVVGGVVVDVGDGANQGVRVADTRHADLLARHELQGAVGTEVQHSISAKHLLQEGVVGSEAVVGGGRPAEQQAHGVTLVAEGGLHANEDVAELLAVDQQLLAVGVELTGGLAPVLLQGIRVLAQTLVLIHLHAVGNVQVAAVELGISAVEHALDQVLLIHGDHAHIVALLLQLLQHPVDGAEHVQVGGGTDIALVRGEAEHSDGQLLLSVALLAQASPVHGTGAQGGDTVGQGVGLAGVAVTASKHNGLNGTIQLGQSNLQGNLHGVHTQLGVQPLLSGLEHQGERHQVGHVQVVQGLHSLGGVLAGRAAHQGETSEGHHSVHEGPASAQGVVEELLHRGAEVQATGKHRHNLGTASLQLRDHTRVVALITGHQVGPLEHQTNHGGIRGKLHVLAGVVPVQVLLQVLIHHGGSGVPDADLREQHGVLHSGTNVHTLEGRHVGHSSADQQVLKVLSVATQPVLQGLHEVACILSLVAGQELEHLGQGAHQLEQTLLKVVIVLSC
mmetsp:Transcript_21009/g.46075  ORF Transcript_21009/g.46075 Transcript_21009/m.46075 type:complete len:1268 (+) Transcript_21009:731-4534(+)